MKLSTTSLTTALASLANGLHHPRDSTPEVPLAPAPAPAPAPTPPGHFRISPLDGSKIALPTREQLAFQDREMGVLIHFNMATYIAPDGCNGDPTLVPPRSLFDPAQLDTDQWMRSVKDAGGRFATLVAKHNCGFATWPSRATLRGRQGGRRVAYNYTIAQSPVRGKDVVASFAGSAEKYGVGHGFYYSVVVNNFLNVQDSKVREGPTAPGQLGVTTEEYNDVVFEQLTELWEKYGNLTEVWFDGGYSGDQKARIQTLLEQTQPQAVIFNGCQDDGTCVSPNSIRWVGNELGYAEEENWSTGLTGSGQSDSPFFVPAECDTTLQTQDRWFYGVGQPLRPLAELIDVYHRSVGRNCILSLDMSPDRRGLVPDAHAARYKELGDFVRSCYDHPVRPSCGKKQQRRQRGAEDEKEGTHRLVFDNKVDIDRVVLMEDQTNGQVIRTYQVWGRQEEEAGGSAPWALLSSGTSVGHKKIDLFGRVVSVSEVMVNSTFVDTPRWRSVTVHKC